MSRGVLLRTIVRDGAPQSEVGFIYFVAPRDSGEPIKIGFTRDLRKRFIAYTTHSPTELVLMALAEGPEIVEALLHRLFKLDRLHGEWFKPSTELHSIIEAYRYAPGLPIHEMQDKPEERMVGSGRQLTYEMTKASRTATTATKTTLPWMTR